MNFGKGLKRIINIPFWIWIILGLIFLLNNFSLFKEWLVFGLIVPIIIKYVVFYVIDGFFNK